MWLYCIWSGKSRVFETAPFFDILMQKLAAKGFAAYISGTTTSATLVTKTVKQNRAIRKILLQWGVLYCTYYKALYSLQ